MLRIVPISAFNDNYIWCIIHPQNQQCVIVDPGTAEPVLKFLKEQNLGLIAILITHHHGDHTGGIADILQQCPVPVYGPAHDYVSHLTHHLLDEDIVDLQPLGIKFRVLEIPGHTRGHIAFYGKGLLFSGDTLFTAGCGRLFEGTAAQMVAALTKLAALPPETLVYCGHEYTLANLRFAQVVEPQNPDILARIEQVKTLRAQNQPTVPAELALEKLTNPFLRCQEPAVIKAAQNYAQESLPTPIDVFAVLREWKNGFP
jgi:hydroxyacylglutathione hydrolase